ncbi:DUF1003 domain-containing protein [Allorhizobium sp. BGMRC 0089]|uniref:DUF1003 domain-containing protein n=1 Tax=Allorhizobium sonneratiae TaxID=2934936 RepID=UPI0020347FF0|nr:DUF1003 domain-containing protein [Allorhizobium sonneratiae]MCM2293193.1 DUF1003 domain-containing protein [Allorhizobium sonneratiae]
MLEKQIKQPIADQYICEDHLSALRRHQVETLLEEERGELSALDRKVLDDFASNVSTVKTLNEATNQKEDFGNRAADAVAAFGGSWTFILMFCAILVCWMAVNSLFLLQRAFDPYPYILLNLVLSCIAALQAPIIMMSQKRQEEKDRQRAENDYMINLRAELEIRQLHEKLDHQMARQWERLAEIQQIQIDLLESGKRPAKS